jgi:hypothetical protein
MVGLVWIGRLAPRSRSRDNIIWVLVATQVQYRSNRTARFETVLVLHQLFSVWKLKRAGGQDARSLQPMGEVRTKSVIAN